MVSHKHKCIFIHQRKTGGSSIITSFGLTPKDKEWHLFNDGPLSQEWKLKDGIAKGYIIFTVVRNPWDRFISAWKYLKACRDKTLTEVLGDLAKIEKNTHDYRHILRPQLDILIDDGGNFIPDYVLRFENLQEDFNNLCRIIGKNIEKLPHMNETEHKHYTAYYEAQTREAVKSLFKKDIDYFKYKFGEDSNNVRFSTRNI